MPEKPTYEELQQRILELEKAEFEYKQTEGALNEALHLARSTMDSLSAHICVLDEAGKILVVNESWRKFARFNSSTDPSAYVGTNYVMLCDTATGLSTEGAKEFAAGIRAVIKSERAEFSMEYPCHSPSEQRWFMGRVTRFADKGPVRVVVAHENITERKLAEEALRKSEERFRSISKSIPGVIYQFVRRDNGVYEIPFVSESAVRFLGRPLEELHNASQLFDDVHPDDLEGMWSSIEESARTMTPWLQEFRVVGKKGTQRWLRGVSSPGPLPDGGICWNGVLLDITELKQAEDNLRRSESLLRSIFQAAPIGIGVVSNRVFLTVNDMFCEMTGYSREEMIGQRTRMIYNSDADFEFVGTEPYRQIHEHGTGMTETRWQRKDGSVIDVLMNFAPINTSNLDEGVAITALDITERKKAEEGKDKLQAQLLQAQKMESVGRLAGGVAHDFNNMLNVILGYTELSMEKLAPLDPVQADLKEILSAARHSADITRQLLAFARKQIIAPKVLDLNNTVEDMLKMLRRLIGEDIDLAWLPGKNLGRINMDPSQLDQILANLCVNARDAITGVGRVSIETANATFGSDYCSDHSWCIPGDFVLLAVTDTGCGMDTKTVDQIFEPFFTTKELNKGTGLGLATVYGIVKQNDGFIHVYSEPGKGTTFKIYLPRDTSPVQNAEENTPKIPFSHGETVLVVEDEGSILRLTEEILKGLGYTTITANTPGKAINLSKVHSGQIDLLITDVIMPEMNGQQLAEQLMILYPKIKCLFMSGYTTNVIVHRGLLNSGLNFIQKPYSRKGLAVKIREVLES
jgi:PAS domain S-box-containing protein